MGVKRKNGEEISIYLPYQTIKQIDERKGEYLSRSRFVYWALNEFLKGNDIADGISNVIEKGVPQGAQVSSQTPSGKVGAASNNDVQTKPPVREELARVVG
jgi:hypothetical protein